MKRFTYPVHICRRDLDGFYCQGLYLAYCPDISEAIAVGTTVEEALAEVTRELGSAIAKRIVFGHEIPLQWGFSSDYSIAVPDALARLASKYLKANKGKRLRKKSFLQSQHRERVETLVSQRRGASTLNTSDSRPGPRAG